MLPPEPQVGPVPPAGHRRWSLAFRPAWWVRGLALVAAALMALGLVFAGLALLIVASSVLLAGLGASARRRSALSCLPVAAVLVAVLVAAVSMAAAALHLDLMASAGPARAALVLACVLVGLASVRWPGSPVLVARVSEIVAVAPAAWVLLWGARLVQAGPVAQLNWLFSGGDNLNHLLLTSGIQRVGHLSYSHQGYPRLLHTVAAQLAAAHGRRSVDLANLVRTADSLARVEWFGWALAVMASGLFAHAVVRRVDAAYAAVAGLAVAVLLLGEQYFSFSMRYGFATSALLVLLLAAGALELLERRPGSASSVLVATGIFVAFSHTWQLAMVPAGLAVLLTLVLWWPARPALPWVASGIAVCLALSVPPLAYVVLHLGVAGVAQRGGTGPLDEQQVAAALAVSALMAVAGLVVAVVRTGRRLTALRWTLVVGSPALLGASAYLLARAAHTTTDSYYPRKLLWNAAALGLCLVCAALGLLPALAGRALARLHRSLRLVPLVAVVPLLSGVAPLLTPVQTAAGGRWSNAPLVLQALSTPHVDRADTAWLLYPRPGARVIDYHVEILLQYWHLDGDVLGPRQPPLLAFMTPAGRCSVFQQHRHLLVLSGQSAARLRTFAHCAGVGGSRIAVLPRTSRG